MNVIFIFLKKGIEQLFSLEIVYRVTGDSLNLCCERFRLDFRKKFFPEKVVWH